MGEQGNATGGARSGAGERRWPGILVRLVLSAALVSLALLLVDLEAVAAQLRRADSTLLAAALLCQVLGYPFMTVRWRMILRHDGVEAGYFRLVLIYVESGFFGLVLPSAIGGDVYRAAALHREIGGVRRTAVNLLTERLIGVWAVCFLAVIGVLVAGPLQGELRVDAHADILVAVALACTGVAVGSALAISRAAQGLVGRLLERLRLRRFAALHDLVFTQFHAYMRRPRWIGQLILLSMLLQAFIVASIYCVSLATGLDLDFWFFLLVMPVVWLLSLMPAIAGIGPREAGLAAMMVAAGVDREQAVAVAVLSIGVLVAKAGVGGLVFLLRSLWPRPAARSD